MSELRVHRSIRAVLLTQDLEILLMKIQNPTPGGWTGWVTPGGSIEAGETEHDCLRRELFEELGFRVGDIGPFLWRRVHQYEWGGHPMEARQDFYLVRCSKFTPTFEGFTETEKREVKEVRWWKLTEFESTSELFAPMKISELLADLVRAGPPREHLEIGI